MPGKAAAQIAISRLCGGGCFSPPAVRPRFRSCIHPEEAQILPNLPNENSNRESADDSARPNNDSNSNRESANDSAHRNIGFNSNREKEHGFPTRLWRRRCLHVRRRLRGSPPAFRPRVSRQIQPADIRIRLVARVKNSNQETKALDFFPKITLSTKINSTRHPQSLFRLERTPTYYFQQLTRILIEPMFRLELKNLIQSNSSATIQRQQTSNRSQFLIRSPRRTNHLTHPRNLSPNPRSSHPKFSQEGVLNIAFANADNRKPTTLASFHENFAEELPLRSMQQWMRGQNFHQRRERPARSQHDRGTLHPIFSSAQVGQQIAENRSSQSARIRKTPLDKFRSARNLKILSKVIRLLSPSRRPGNPFNAPPLDNLHFPAIKTNRNQRHT